MRISNNGLNEIGLHEGLRLEAYLCPAKVWTIGYGSTFYEDGTPVKKGDKITNERAIELLRNIVQRFENNVNAHNLDVNQNQHDALVSFSFNVGMKAFNNSTLLKKVKANPNDPTITNEFMKWNKAGGKELRGLTNRRIAENKLYFKK